MARTKPAASWRRWDCWGRDRIARRPSAELLGSCCRRWPRSGSCRALLDLDRGRGQQLLLLRALAFVAHHAGHGRGLAARADLVVVLVADVVLREVVHHVFAALADLEDVLALLGRLEVALAAAEVAAQRDLFALGGGGGVSRLGGWRLVGGAGTGREREREREGHDECAELFHAHPLPHSR